MHATSQQRRTPSLAKIDLPPFFTLLVAALVMSGPGVVRAAADAPTIRLFPTTVLEDIRHTGDAAQEIRVLVASVMSP